LFAKDIKYHHNLELMLRCDRGKTVPQHQYTTFPLRLSTPFRLEGINSNRVYHYLINTSPGLLAGDELSLSLKLAEDTQLYLTEQAATKVHPMPNYGKATVEYQIKLEANASLELVPEPVILYADSILEQKTVVKLHPTARLFISEIILPGRIARQEYYDFNYYLNRLQILDLTGKLLLRDAIRLVGKQNQFQNNRLFTSRPVIGNAIAIIPDLNLDWLNGQIENIKLAKCQNIELATSIIPSNNGLVIRAMSDKTIEIKKYFTYVINCIRAINHQTSLPYIAK
jgi:urease accessory protein